MTYISFWFSAFCANSSVSGSRRIKNLVTSLWTNFFHQRRSSLKKGKSKLFFFKFHLSLILVNNSHWRWTKVETTGATQDYKTLISRLFETFLDFETKKQVVPWHQWHHLVRRHWIYYNNWILYSKEKITYILSLQIVCYNTYCMYVFLNKISILMYYFYIWIDKRRIIHTYLGIIKRWIIIVCYILQLHNLNLI